MKNPNQSGKQNTADPDEKTIREMCLLIQSEWTPEERILRSRGGYGDGTSEIGGWTVPQVRTRVSIPHQDN